MNITGYITKLVLPILIFLVIVSAVQNITNESVEPRKENILNMLAQSTGTIKIGYYNEGGVTGQELETLGERQFREMLIFNMLGAQHCNFITLARKKYSAPNRLVSSYNDVNDGKMYAPNLKLGDDVLMFGYLVDTTGNLYCPGTSESNPLKVEIRRVLDTKIAEATGYDLEGKFSRTGFIVNKTVFIQDEKLVGVNWEETNSIQGDSEPDFWKGNRLSAMIPPGIEANNGCLGRLLHNQEYPWLYDGENSGADVPGTSTIHLYGSERKSLYAYRVRMINVPMIQFGTNFHDDRVVKMCGTESEGKDFVKASSYLLCKDAEGYVQSNAENVDYTGEADSDNPIPEDVVYPKVEITSEADACLESYGANNKDLVFHGDTRLTHPNSGNKCTWGDVRTGREVDGWKCVLKDRQVWSNTDDIGQDGKSINYYNAEWKEVS